MTDVEKAKLMACGKVAFGVAKMVGGVVTATGHGLIGGFCRNHGAMQSAMRLGAYSVSSGKELIDRGMAELKSVQQRRLGR